jgi:hypothetical protein
LVRPDFIIAVGRMLAGWSGRYWQLSPKQRHEISTPENRQRKRRGQSLIYWGQFRNSEASRFVCKREEFEYVSTKPLGTRCNPANLNSECTGTPVKEFRGCRGSTLFEWPDGCRGESRGCSGQTTENFYSEIQEVIGVRIPSYASVTLTSRFGFGRTAAPQNTSHRETGDVFLKMTCAFQASDALRGLLATSRGTRLLSHILLILT